MSNKLAAGPFLTLQRPNCCLLPPATSEDETITSHLRSHNLTTFQPSDSWLHGEMGLGPEVFPRDDSAVRGMRRTKIDASIPMLRGGHARHGLEVGLGMWGPCLSSCRAVGHRGEPSNHMLTIVLNAGNRLVAALLPTREHESTTPNRFSEALLCPWCFDL